MKKYSTQVTGPDGPVLFDFPSNFPFLARIFLLIMAAGFLFGAVSMLVALLGGSGEQVKSNTIAWLTGVSVLFLAASCLLTYIAFYKKSYRITASYLNISIKTVIGTKIKKIPTNEIQAIRLGMKSDGESNYMALDVIVSDSGTAIELATAYSTRNTGYSQEELTELARKISDTLGLQLEVSFFKS